MRSDRMKKGLERAPHRSLFKALGLTDQEIERPMIGIANSANELIPGHLHLHQISAAVKAGILAMVNDARREGGVLRDKLQQTLAPLDVSELAALWVPTTAETRPGASAPPA